MNYCKYKSDNGHIVEISAIEIFEEGEYLVCRTNIENIETHELFVSEVRDGTLVAYKSYKKVGG